MSWVAGAERFYPSSPTTGELKLSPAIRLHRPKELPAVDLVTYEVVSHRLWQICDEMATTIRRVSGSPVATESGDFTTVISDEAGAGVYMGPYVVYHAVVLEHMIRWTLENRAENPGIGEGDMYLCNDPWVGAAHQNDFAVYAPLFVAGELFAWSGTTIHQVDVGGPSPGSFSIAAEDIFGEQPPVPPIKVVRNRVLQADVEDVYIRRSRVPQMLQLDLRAQVAANNVAHARIGELIAKYGTDTVKAVLKEVMARTEGALRKRLRELPSGTWRHVANIEMAKAGDRKVYQVRCAMNNRDGELNFDFTGTHEQVGMINGATGAARAGVLAAVLTMLTGDMTWATGAISRAITLTNPRGTIVNAEYPAAVSTASTSATWLAHNCAQATIAKMLSAHPEHRRWLLAGGSGSWPAMQMMGFDQYGQAFVTQLQEPDAAGFGARAWADGVNTGGIYAFPAARTANVELTELVWPLLVLYRKQVADTGGAGRWRGGVAGNFAFISYQTDVDLVHVSAQFCVAFPSNGGINGGFPGSASRHLIRRNSNVRELIAMGRMPQRLEDVSGKIELLNAKCQTTQAQEDFYEITFFGGAGFGDPLDRPPELVKADVTKGLVSREAAFGLYGVVLDTRSNGVDAAASEARRREIRCQRLGGTAPPDGVPRRWDSRIMDEEAAISEYLRCEGDRVACRKCGRDIGPRNENHKLYLVSLVRPVTELSPYNRDPSHYVDVEIVCRSFHCPGCATQIEVEITDTTLPPVWDCQLDAEGGEEAD